MKKTTKAAVAVVPAIAATLILFTPVAQADTKQNERCGNFTTVEGSTSSYFWGNCGFGITQIDVYRLPQWTFVTTLCAPVGSEVLLGRADSEEGGFVALDMALPC
ncbi:hypothetical protein [Actinophytocola sp.]|jgi:hypothetical protein|uniref:hypothetical protein n=1 Tax=Actinophytocola sp. TaxID=1872138 RepID=UPI002ED7C174